MTVIATQVERPDGRVELLDTSRVEQSALYNEDLAPVPIARPPRTEPSGFWS